MSFFQAGWRLWREPADQFLYLQNFPPYFGESVFHVGVFPLMGYRVPSIVQDGSSSLLEPQAGVKAAKGGTPHGPSLSKIKVGEVFLLNSCS